MNSRNDFALSPVRKLGPGSALYSEEVAGRTAWHVRKVRAFKWTNITSVKSVERYAEEYWWPAFLMAVEHSLASAHVTPASQQPDRGVGQFELTARQIQLSGAVRQALDAARTSCEAKHRAFYTPDLLLALLDMPRSRTTSCFDETRAGLAGDVRERLSRRINGLNTNPVHPSHPFEWPERPEVQVAQDLAALDRSPVVTEIYLLLGVLGSESSTRTELEEHLGSDDYDRLCAITNGRRPHPPDGLRTPGPS